mgnify:CR=1 FL=1
MHLKSLYFQVLDEGKVTERLIAYGTTIMPGVGEVQTEEVLSSWLIERIQAEVLAEFKIKLGKSLA